MKKSTLVMLLSMALIATGCSKETKVDASKPKEEKVDKEVNSETKVEKAEQVIQKEKNNTYKHSQYKYVINLDDRLLENDNYTIVEEGLTTKIYYDDKTLLKDKVLVGQIETMSATDWEQSHTDETEYIAYVLNDDGNNKVHVYTENPVDPYESHYEEDEYGEALPLAESIAYQRVGSLLILSLTNSNFIHSWIEVKQEIPSELDSNQQVGIKLSEDYYNDFKKYHDTLAAAVDKGNREETHQILGSIIDEVTMEYSEFRQIPFPTFELGNNIVEGIQSFHWMNELYYSDDELNDIAIERLTKVQEQYLNVIKNQIDEIKNR